MKKLKCFSVIDLSVVIGLVLVLSGASLIMFGKVTKGQRDTERINSANKIFSDMEAFYKGNFRQYPTPKSADDSVGYRSIIIGKDSDTFLQIALGESVKNLKPETSPDYGFVYLYSPDGKQAAIVVRKLESGKTKCNTGQTNLPEIIKDYLTKDPGACYYRSSS